MLDCHNPLLHSKPYSRPTDNSNYPSSSKKSFFTANADSHRKPQLDIMPQQIHLYHGSCICVPESMTEERAERLYESVYQGIFCDSSRNGCINKSETMAISIGMLIQKGEVLIGYLLFVKKCRQLMNSETGRLDSPTDESPC